MNEEMNELPEISFEEKKEKKRRGFIPWFKQKLGIGSRGPVGSTGPSSGMFVTGARIGAGAKFFGVAGSKGFVAAILASKVGTFLVGGLIAVAIGIGTYMAMKESRQGILGFKFDKSSGSYFPWASGGKSDGSSLDMLKGANEGFLEEGAKLGRGKKGKGKGKEAGKEGYGPGGMGDGYGPGGIGGGYGPGGMGDGYGLDGIGGGYGPGGQMGVGGGLASHFLGAGFGTGTSDAEKKLSALGGFANNLGQGAFGSGNGFGSFGAGKRSLVDSKTGKSSSKSEKFIASSKIGSYGSKYGYGTGGYGTGGSGVGGSGSGITGSKGYTVGAQSHGSITSMISQKIPDYAKGDSIERIEHGTGGWDQAKEVRDTQHTFTVGSIDRAREIQDIAWEGTKNPDNIGDVTLETGCVGEGCGIVTPIDKDKIVVEEVSITCPEGTTGVYPDCKPAAIPSPFAIENVPYRLAQEAMKYILIAVALAIVASKLVKIGRALMANPYTFAAGLALFLAGIALALVALGYAVKAMANGIQLMTTWKQPLLGAVYTAGAGFAMLAAILAMAGALWGGIVWLVPLWFGAAAAILAVLGTMFQQIPSGPAIDLSISGTQESIATTYADEVSSDVGESEASEAESEAEVKRKEGAAKDQAEKSRISSISTKKGKRAKAAAEYRRKIQSEEKSANEKAEDAKDKAESEREKAENITGIKIK